jgi:hypothetical protein
MHAGIDGRWLERHGYLQIVMSKIWQRAHSVTIALLMVAFMSSCGVATDTLWSSTVVSPDGSWTATALTTRTSGPGNDYIGTDVYLKRTGARGRGQGVLTYSQETWVPGTIPLVMSWGGGSHLQVTFKQVPNFKVQVCRYGGVDISVNTAP